MSYPEIKPNREIQTQSEKNRDANQFTENVRYSDAIGIHKPNYLSFSVFSIYALRSKQKVTIKPN